MPHVRPGSRSTRPELPPLGQEPSREIEHHPGRHPEDGVRKPPHPLRRDEITREELGLPVSSQRQDAVAHDRPESKAVGDAEHDRGEVEEARVEVAAPPKQGDDTRRQRREHYARHHRVYHVAAEAKQDRADVVARLAEVISAADPGPDRHRRVPERVVVGSPPVEHLDHRHHHPGDHAADGTDDQHALCGRGGCTSKRSSCHSTISLLVPLPLNRETSSFASGFGGNAESCPGKGMRRARPDSHLLRRRGAARRCPIAEATLSRHAPPP